jgi:hypothetical protein
MRDMRNYRKRKIGERGTGTWIKGRFRSFWQWNIRRSAKSAMNKPKTTKTPLIFIQYY